MQVVLGRLARAGGAGMIRVTGEGQAKNALLRMIIRCIRESRQFGHETKEILVDTVREWANGGVQA